MPRRGSDALSVRSCSICSSSSFDVDTALAPAAPCNHADSFHAAQLEQSLLDVEMVASRRRLLLWPRSVQQAQSRQRPSSASDAACALECIISPPSPSQEPRTNSDVVEQPPPPPSLHRSLNMMAWPRHRPVPLSSNLECLLFWISERFPSVPLISPDSALRTAWLGLLILATAITAIELPYRLGFEPAFGPGAARVRAAAYTRLELLVDVVFLLDTILHSRLAYWQDVSVVVDPYLILCRYAKSPGLLALNLLASASFPLSCATSYAVPWVRLPTLLRVLQLERVTDDFIYQLRGGGVRSDDYSARKLRNIVCTAVFIVHITASLYGLTFGAAYPESSSLPSFKLTYTYAIWWTASALSALGVVRTPQPMAELAFTTLVLVGALCTTIYLIAHLGVLISNLDASALTLRKDTKATDLFIRRHGLPDSLAARIRRYQRLAWARGTGRNLRTVVGHMNSTIRGDIMHHICHSVVISVPLFMSCDPKLISVLMGAIVHEVYPQDEWICHCGSIATCMYMILRGEVAVVVDEARMISVAKLHRGDFFGERSLFGLEKRNASILAKSMVDIAKLSAETFSSLLKDHPILHDVLQAAKTRREAEMAVAQGLMQEQQSRYDELRGRRSAASQGRRSVVPFMLRRSSGRRSSHSNAVSEPDEHTTVVDVHEAAAHLPNAEPPAACEDSDES
jgi:CRP-like cAMP-binding protein